MRSQDRKVSAEQLLSAIENALNAGPRSINELARELGYSATAISWRLDLLAIERRAHRRKVEFMDDTGVSFLWFHGARVNVLIAATEPQANVPVQGSVREYPAIDRRDPLVAALFGPARKAVKRCI